ncbi:MAG TPA: hypothetical protein VH165_15195 [Kofleriaceae bacterium]|jgi:hypothetical protein|nr:hypothetical protein [Kofleriaceae bacterium]
MRLDLAMMLLLGVVGACKGDPVKCEQGCRNFATLVYWKNADAEIAHAPADQRDALRKKKLGELDKQLERGLDMCVTQCQSANNTDDIDCLVGAKTADQALACMK